MKIWFFAGIISAIFAAALGSEGGPASFPYKAIVVEHQARVRGGPGQAYPVTGYLAFGSEVEVYRHDPGGWCAIRPPQGSYSWVLADAVQLLPNGLAKVTRSGVPSYVGGVDVPDRRLSHVALQDGELLEVLGVQQIPSDLPSPDPSLKTWLKIRPPSGEFRWIHVASIRLEGSGGSLPPRGEAEKSGKGLRSDHSARTGSDGQISGVGSNALDGMDGLASPGGPADLRPQHIPTVPIPQETDSSRAGMASETGVPTHPGPTSAVAGVAADPLPMTATHALPTDHTPTDATPADVAPTDHAPAVVTAADLDPVETDHAPAEIVGTSEGSGVIVASGALTTGDPDSRWVPMARVAGSVGVLREQTLGIQGTRFGQESAGLRFRSPLVPSRNVAPLSAEECVHQMRALELELATRLAERPEAWDLRGLRRRVEDLHAAAPDEESRRQISRLREKVAQAEQVAAQWRTITGTGSPAPVASAGGLSRGVAGEGPTASASSVGIPRGPLPAAERATRIAPPPTAIVLPPISAGSDLRNDAAANGAGDSRVSNSVIPASAVASTTADLASRPLLPNGSGPTGTAGALVEETSHPIPSREQLAREIMELRRSRFDAVGRLIRAQVRRPGDPPYALVGEDGRILAYVKPATGLSLRAHVGRTVGVMGRFTGSREMRLLTAEHVAVLDSRAAVSTYSRGPTPAPTPAATLAPTPAAMPDPAPTPAFSPTPDPASTPAREGTEPAVRFAETPARTAVR